MFFESTTLLRTNKYIKENILFMNKENTFLLLFLSSLILQ